MIYRVFAENSQAKLAQVQDANWPLLQKGDTIPLKIEDKDSLYTRDDLFTVVKVGAFGWEGNTLVVDVWVKDYFKKRDAVLAQRLPEA